ncbi:unnamed protein product [Paramecium sonneborni]|uniref:Uncharacterized protein n=1 Tax=Paramecium sonneborni TaxID=65129 RepID=A0A8S1MMT9_9CILI|nr:unnamed protein product [Paramecium sonneborni]
MNKEQQENISDESMYYNDDFEHISGNYYQTEQNISTQEYYSEYKSRKQKYSFSSIKIIQKISKDQQKMENIQEKTLIQSFINKYNYQLLLKMFIKFFNIIQHIFIYTKCLNQLYYLKIHNLVMLFILQIHMQSNSNQLFI